MCRICHCLIIEPRKCSTCKEAIFCLECISTSNECPSCKESPALFEEDKTLLKFLEKEQFSCPSTETCSLQQNIPYQELLEHFKEDCPEVTIKCFMKGCKAIPFKRKHLIDHLMNECQYLSLECPNCLE